ncbi:hypothetical protein I317_03633 [Kwoniella heveanensis CBS 569]|nr:hypothetical protein I317_03633 [Kwoniella heveanensis CBS 569]
MLFIHSILLAFLALPLGLSAPSSPHALHSLSDLRSRAASSQAQSATSTSAGSAAAAAVPTTLASIQSADFKSLLSSEKIPQNCPINKTLTVPLSAAAGGTLAVPAGQAVSMITVGRGVQNYTCTNGTYVSAGALANLFDVSCLFSLTAKSVNPAKLSELLPKLAFKASLFSDAGKLPIAINHLFVATPNSATPGISPEFALSSGSDQIIVSKLGASPAPSDPGVNVPWLQLTAIEGQGTLAKSVFRVDTVNGQPPSSCTTEGESLSVNYASMYWFTK